MGDICSGDFEKTRARIEDNPFLSDEQKQLPPVPKEVQAAIDEVGKQLRAQGLDYNVAANKHRDGIEASVFKESIFNSKSVDVDAGAEKIKKAFANIGYDTDRVATMRGMNGCKIIYASPSR